MEMMNDYVQLKKFSEIDLSDEFFDSLKLDYDGFETWFKNKQGKEEQAYVMILEGKISGFMYLKDETEAISLNNKELASLRRMKIGTFKLNTRGTILGDRFLAIALREAVKNNHERVYVTVFEKHKKLIDKFEKFGFERVGTCPSGELFLGKRFNRNVKEEPYLIFPQIHLSNPAYSLSIKPEYHTSLFPDSILHTEKNHIIENLARTNTVRKTYLTDMRKAKDLKPNDLVFIYRQAEEDKTPKRFHSVITSVCTVLEVNNIYNFENYNSFVNYVGLGTIYTEEKLKEFWETKKSQYIIKLLYNFPMERKVNLNDFSSIIDKPIVGTYWGLVDFNSNQALKLLESGNVSESFIIHKT